MRVWIASFLVLFGMAELYQWLKHFTLPLPVYILGGAFLAISSNYERITGFPFQKTLEDKPTAIPSQMPVNLAVEQSQLNQSNLLTTPKNQQPRPVSFTIRKPAPEKAD